MIGSEFHNYESQFSMRVAFISREVTAWTNRKITSRGLRMPCGDQLRSLALRFVERVDPIVEKAKSIRRLGHEIATDGLTLLRDLVHERPIIVFSVVGATAFLLARIVSFRALATVATIGVQGAQLGASALAPTTACNAAHALTPVI